MLEIAKQFESDELLWGLFYLAHYFKSASPDFHVDILEDSKIFPSLAVQAPRGSAKSTMLTMIKPTHGICYKKYHFIIIIQNTYKKSAASLENIKFEFRDNDMVKTYGVELEKDAEGDTIFKHPDGFRTRVISKGADQLGTLRGERFGAYRPDLFLIDDLEDDELVRNVERRIELEKNFNEVLKYAGDASTRMIVVGTILHDDSLMAKLVARDRYKNFRKLFFKARYEWNKDIHSLWPAKWTVEALNQMEKDDPVGFAKEMQGDPSSGSQETILREDFRYWAVVENRIVLYNTDRSIHSKWDYRDCKAAIACDLAWEDKQSSDFSCIMPGLVTPNNDILVCPFIAKRGMRPNELEELIFSWSKKYEELTGKRVQVGFEKAKLEKVMKWFLQEAQRRRNEWLWLKDISWGSKDKVERVLARLGNRYAQHSVYHQSGMGELENQLIRLRSSAHDDLADCAGMLPEMLSFASTKQKEPQKEDMFNFLRKQTSVYRINTKTPYLFGRKTRAPAITSKIALPI